MAKKDDNMMEKAKDEMKKMGQKGGKAMEDMWHKAEGDGDDDRKKKSSKGKNHKMKDSW